MDEQRRSLKRAFAWQVVSLVAAMIGASLGVGWLITVVLAALQGTR